VRLLRSNLSNEDSSIKRSIRFFTLFFALLLVVGTAKASELFSSFQDLSKSLFPQKMYINCFYQSDKDQSYPQSYKLTKPTFGKKKLFKLKKNGEYGELIGNFNETSFFNKKFYPVDQLSPNTSFRSLNIKKAIIGDGPMTLSYEVMKHGLRNRDGVMGAKWMAKIGDFIPQNCDRSFEELFDYTGKCADEFNFSFVKGTIEQRKKCKTIIWLANPSCKRNFGTMAYSSPVIPEDAFENPDFPANYIIVKTIDSKTYLEILGQPRNKQMQFISDPEYSKSLQKCTKVGN